MASLVWALEHPDGETAIRSAGVLAQRRETLAIDPLGRMSSRTDDPYRAAAAVVALRAFPDEPRARAYVEAAETHPSVIVRRAAGLPAGGPSRTPDRGEGPSPRRNG